MTGQKEFMYVLNLTPKAGYVTYDNNMNSQIWGYDILKNDNFSVSNVAYMTDLKHNLINLA